VSGLHLFLELATLASFLATGAWAIRRWGRDGAWLLGYLCALGVVRENFVAVRRLLYGFSAVTFELGRAPLVATVIWAFSILAALAAAEAILGRPVRPAGVPSAGALTVVALFMIALAGFFEPFLALVDLARWEPGTATVLGVPEIALVGYPTFALLAVVSGGWLLARFRTAGSRAVALALAVPPLALGHAWALAWLKRALGW
jgi:hypothetical protein